MKKPRIVHIITGLSDGGAEAVLYRLCTFDNVYLHSVVALADEGKYGPLLRETGISVYCLNIPRTRVRVAAFFALWRLLRKLRPDVVQTWMYHADLLGGVVARVGGTPVVWGIRHTTLERGKSKTSTILIARLLARLSHHVPARIAVCARKAVEVHGDLGYDTTKMRVIPNGYDLSRCTPNRRARQALRAEWGIGDDMPLLGMVGRFDPQKDHTSLLYALAGLYARGRHFLCVLAGSGMDESNAALTGIIKKAGLQDTVRLLGRRNDIPEVMNALDINILSSAFGEAFPNVLAEAMACGTPCVTTDVGDAADIVGDTGWVVPARDPEALAAAIIRALDEWQNPRLWYLRQADARSQIEENYTIANMVERYHRLWQEAIAGPAGISKTTKST